MPTHLKICENCEALFNEDYVYCPYCGQKSKDELTLGVLFNNTISNYFSVDARFFKSFIPLMFKPGFLAKEFVKGKRLLYLHPAQMYLFVVVVFFFIFSFNVRESRAFIDDAMKKDMVMEQKEIDSLLNLKKNSAIKTLDSLDIDALSERDKEALSKVNITINDSLNTKHVSSLFQFNKKKVDSLISINADPELIYKSMGMDDDAGYFKRKLYAQVLKFYKDRGLGAIYQTFIDSIPIAMFFLLPIFGLLLKLFYYKKGRYAHHLVFSFYFFSFLFATFSVLLLFNYLVYDMPDAVDWLIVFSSIVYLLMALKRFYGQRLWVTMVKWCAISSLFLLLIVPIATAIVGMFAFLYY
ncbi:MAG: DUF3667 domain-containing protein [Algicola sp.]|nr:DUF3667 domain-containing protein [Algicola sp.]